ncbi:MAG: nucleotidyltransferase family protein [Bacteroidales bacterium]|nr:nucleotidyltransferase family protein [Bacteroidales bacterium]
MTEVIILAGGLGTRLRSVVNDKPKCMAEVNGKPFLYYWLQYLARFSFKRIVLSLGYKSEMVISWIEKIRDNYDFIIDYVVEQEPLGTGGGIRLALNKTSTDDVFVINGDSMFLADLQDLYNKYSLVNCSVVLALKQMKDFSRYGKVTIDSNNLITDFAEKKFCQQGLINCGVYVLNKQKLNLQSFEQKFSFEKDVLEQRNDIYGFEYEGYFIDIGVPEDYHKAQKDFSLLPMFK